MISLKRQILAMFLGLMFLVVGLVFLINAGLMEPYYIDYKQNEMLRSTRRWQMAQSEGRSHKVSCFYRASGPIFRRRS